MHQAEAAQFLSAWVQRGGQHPFDLVFLDAFDGEDNVPEQLSTPGKPIDWSTRDSNYKACLVAYVCAKIASPGKSFRV